MTGAGSLSPSPQPVMADPDRTLTLRGRCRVSPQKGVRRQRSADQGEGVPQQKRKAAKAECRMSEGERRLRMLLVQWRDDEGTGGQRSKQFAFRTRHVDGGLMPHVLD